MKNVRNQEKRSSKPRDPSFASPECLSAARRYRRGGLFTRRNAERVKREGIIQRARFLPDTLRAIVNAYYERGVTVPELASLHHISIRQMRYKVEHLYDVLTDPAFLLAAQFAHHLPDDLAPLARGYWIEGRTVRELAGVHHTTLHAIRTQIHRAQSLLVVAMAGEQKVSPEMAGRVLQ